jgi:hypothetical protein
MAVPIAADNKAGDPANTAATATTKSGMLAKNRTKPAQ